MAVQPENKIFPHVVPPLPERSGNLKEDFDSLYRWIFDQQKSLDELNRQVVDKYNLHISGTHAHPSAWTKWRLRRPRYYAASSGGTTITVPASTDIPSLFVINGELFEIYENLTCDLSGSGVGGLDTGSIAANTPYYLYGVKSSDTVAIIASATDPGSGGPTGYDSAWTYIGACATDRFAANFTAFDAIDGFYLCDDEIEIRSVSAGGSRTATTFNTMPVTVRKAYCQLQADAGAGASIGDTVSACGTDATHDALSARVLGAGIDGYVHGFIPVLTEQTLYLTPHANVDCSCQFTGWQEDPTEYM